MIMRGEKTKLALKFGAAAVALNLYGTSAVAGEATTVESETISITEGSGFSNFLFNPAPLHSKAFGGKLSFNKSEETARQWALKPIELPKNSQVSVSLKDDVIKATNNTAEVLQKRGYVSQIVEEKPKVVAAPSDNAVETKVTANKTVEEELAQPVVAFGPAAGVDHLGQCSPTQAEKDYFSTVFMDDASGTEAVGVIDQLARKIVADKYYGVDVVAHRKGSKKAIEEVQKLLMRANCYVEHGHQVDGKLGSKTQNAILNFVQSYKHIYANLEEGLIYGDAEREKTGEPVGVQLLGVNSDVTRALADVAARKFIFTNAKIADANKDINPHSYNLALYKEFRGDFLGQQHPNYVQLRVTAKDIDIMGRTMFGEVRGERHKGQIAAAFSVLNRTMARILDSEVNQFQFKETLAETSKAGLKNRKQYSVWNVNDPNYKKAIALKTNGAGENDRIFEALKGVIKNDVISMDGLYNDPVKGADHYHAVYVKPRWDWSQLKFIDRIGVHKFFRLKSHKVSEMYTTLSEVKQHLQQMNNLYQKNSQRLQVGQNSGVNKKAPKRAL